MRFALIVLTRPLHASRRFARDLRMRGVTAPILFAPVLEIRALPLPRMPEGTIVLTSENGVAAAAGRMSLGGRSVVAVGPRTGAAAERHGADVTVLGEDAGTLAAALIERGGGPYIHLHGRHVTGDLAGELRRAGIEAASFVIYEQAPRDLTGAALAALAGPVRTVLPIFSARSARLVGEQLVTRPPNTAVIALSPKIAESWPWTEAALVARTVRASAMLDMVAQAVAGTE